VFLGNLAGQRPGNIAVDGGKSGSSTFTLRYP